MNQKEATDVFTTREKNLKLKLIKYATNKRNIAEVYFRLGKLNETYNPPGDPQVILKYQRAAIDYYKLSIQAESTFAPSIVQLAVIKEKGIGTEVDEVEARRLNNVACSIVPPHAAAQFNLARMHRDGIGGPVNRAMAEVYFEASVRRSKCEWGWLSLSEMKFEEGKYEEAKQIAQQITCRKLKKETFILLLKIAERLKHSQELEDSTDKKSYLRKHDGAKSLNTTVFSYHPQKRSQSAEELIPTSVHHLDEHVYSSTPSMTIIQPMDIELNNGKEDIEQETKLEKSDTDYDPDDDFYDRNDISFNSDIESDNIINEIEDDIKQESIEVVESEVFQILTDQKKNLNEVNKELTSLLDEHSDDDLRDELNEKLQKINDRIFKKLKKKKLPKFSKIFQEMEKIEIAQSIKKFHENLNNSQMPDANENILENYPQLLRYPRHYRSLQQLLQRAKNQENYDPDLLLLIEITRDLVYDNLSIQRNRLSKQWKKSVQKVIRKSPRAYTFFVAAYSEISARFLATKVLQSGMVMREHNQPLDYLNGFAKFISNTFAGIVNMAGAGSGVYGLGLIFSTAAAPIHGLAGLGVDYYYNRRNSNANEEIFKTGRYAEELAMEIAKTLTFIYFNIIETVGEKAAKDLAVDAANRIIAYLRDGKVGWYEALHYRDFTKTILTEKLRSVIHKDIISCVSLFVGHQQLKITVSKKFRMDLKTVLGSDIWSNTDILVMDIDKNDGSRKFIRHKGNHSYFGYRLGTLSEVKGDYREKEELFIDGIIPPEINVFLPEFFKQLLEKDEINRSK